MHTRLQLLRGSRPAAVLLCAAVLLLSGNAATAYADTPDPQLSIAVDNGSASAKSGDELRYTITVTNLGTQKVKGLRVNQTVPTGASVVSADEGGDEGKGKISWKVDLAAAQKVTMHTSLSLGATPGSALRLATVACAQVSAKGPALVCASDSDQLPAGAAAEAAQAPAPPSSGWLDGRTPWYLGGGAALVLVLVGALLLVLRHRHPGAGMVAHPAPSDVG
jgi:uncharacterized repeat protein (TIGR01451 family)